MAATAAEARPTSAVENSRAATIQKTMPSAELATVENISAKALRKIRLARTPLTLSALNTGAFYVGTNARQARVTAFPPIWGANGRRRLCRGVVAAYSSQSS